MNEAFLKTMVALVAGLVSFLLFATLLFRRIDRVMPVFVAYIGLYIAEGLGSAAAIRYMQPEYPAVYLASCTLDLFFAVAVLIEAGGNVLRSNHLPTDGWIKRPAMLFGGSSLLLWPMLRWSNPPRLPAIFWIDLSMTRADTIFSVTAILALLVWSSALKLRWPERELRVVTGMSLMALISFAVLLFYVNGKVGHQYYWLDLLTPLTCVLVFLYWLFYFGLDAGATAVIGNDHKTLPHQRTTAAQ